MALVPVFCDNCGTVFASHGVVGGTGARIQMTGVRVGPCPKCGAMGKVPDGVYDVIDDALSVVQGEDLPTETLQEVVSVLEGFVGGSVTGDEALRRVEQEAPDLAPLVKVYLQRPDPLRWVMLLLAILAVAMAGPATAEDVANLLSTSPQSPKVSSQHVSGSPTAQRKAKPRRNRAPKTHGKRKKRRRR